MCTIGGKIKIVTVIKDLLMREMTSELVKMPANVCNLLFKQILLQKPEVHRYALENKF